MTGEYNLKQAVKLSAIVLFALGINASIVSPSSAEGIVALPSGAAQDNVFQKPRHAELQHRLTLEVVELLRTNRYAEAESKLRDLTVKFPDWPLHHYVLATLLARQGKVDDALASLDQAIRNGFANRLGMERDPNLSQVRGDPRFQALLDRMNRQEQSTPRKPTVVSTRKVTDGIALVDEANTVWEPNSNTLISAFSFPEKPWSARVRGGDDAISRRLNLLYGKRQAAGNHGDLYDNRDKGHSPLSHGLYPQFSHIKYGTQAAAAGVNYGVNAHQLFNAITIGNSSTAIAAGGMFRSQARFIQTNPMLIARAFLHYANDQIYVFPEHHDHDPGNGDLFPANTPYMLVSQGSSSSDRPFLGALAAILGAFKPEVKDFLRARHLVMPTVQMIFRSGLKQIATSDDYLSGKAHPSVFDGSEIDLRKMVFQANSLRKDEVPPRVDIKLVDESIPITGISYFGPMIADEVLFNTPSAISRVIRSTDLQKKLVLSTAGTADPNGRQLTFEWRVLRGDPDLIEITKRKDDGSEVELSVKWHQRRRVTFNPELMSSRVDIGIFAYNGKNYSAPAFVSLSYPTRQHRKYNAAGQILEVTYDPPDTKDIYQDPLLFPQRDWQDKYRYTDDGKLIGWDRITKDRTQSFTSDGARVVERDMIGRPLMAEKLRYTLQVKKSGQRQVVAVPTGAKVFYRYRNDADLIGTPSDIGSQ